jgi:putative ABC transport system substrate-binding protein
MRRRKFITLLGGAVSSWPLAVRAQQPPMPVIGFLSNFTTDQRYADAFRQGIGDFGYVEDQNVLIEYHWAEGGQYDRLRKVAADLVSRRVAVIVASPITAALAAKAATSTIPIVFAIGSDPVESGLVTSINRPGGNVTGVGFLAVALGAKRLELLRELVPKVASIAFLVNPNNTNADLQTKETKLAAVGVGLDIDIVNASSIADFDSVFTALARQRSGALIVGVDPFFISQRDHLIALAARYKVPTIFYAREFTGAGGLMSYGADLALCHRQAGVYAGRILKGGKPGDLPIMLSDKFEFVINLKTAKTLGIEVPARLLALADEVIE